MLFRSPYLWTVFLRYLSITVTLHQIISHVNTPPPLPLAGEGKGEGGIYMIFPLTAAMRYPVFPDLFKASRSAFIEILMMGCRYATDRDFILSPRGEERNLFSKQRYHAGSLMSMRQEPQGCIVKARGTKSMGLSLH